MLMCGCIWVYPHPKLCSRINSLIPHHHLAAPRQTVPSPAGDGVILVKFAFSVFFIFVLFASDAAPFTRARLLSYYIYILSSASSESSGSRVYTYIYIKVSGVRAQSRTSLLLFLEGARETVSDCLGMKKKEEEKERRDDPIVMS